MTINLDGKTRIYTKVLARTVRVLCCMDRTKRNGGVKGRTRRPMPLIVPQGCTFVTRSRFPPLTHVCSKTGRPRKCQKRVFFRGGGGRVKGVISTFYLLLLDSEQQSIVCLLTFLCKIYCFLYITSSDSKSALFSTRVCPYSICCESLNTQMYFISNIFRDTKRFSGFKILGEKRENRSNQSCVHLGYWHLVCTNRHK